MHPNFIHWFGTNPKPLPQTSWFGVTAVVVFAVVMVATSPLWATFVTVAELFYNPLARERVKKRITRWLDGAANLFLGRI